MAPKAPKQNFGCQPQTLEGEEGEGGLGGGGGTPPPAVVYGHFNTSPGGGEGGPELVCPAAAVVEPVQVLGLLQNGHIRLGIWDHFVCSAKQRWRGGAKTPRARRTATIPVLLLNGRCPGRATCFRGLSFGIPPGAVRHRIPNPTPPGGARGRANKAVWAQKKRPETANKLHKRHGGGGGATPWVWTPTYPPPSPLTVGWRPHGGGGGGQGLGI